MAKLTEKQLEVLGLLSRKTHGVPVYALGRGTCEALRKRGMLARTGGNYPINRMCNPYVEITDLGRAQLSENSNAR